MSKPHDIDSLVEEVVTLPSLPGTVSHLIQLVSDPQCPLTEVAKAISADPALAMKTLRLVNSAYYGVRQKIATIEHAVVLLGIKVIKNLAFTATVFDIMKGSADAFLQHSVASGVAMRALLESLGRPPTMESVEEAFVYGLLHDIGKVIFEQFLPDEYARVLELARGRGIPWYQAEREIIGIDHAQLGARLAQNWKLPDHLVHGIEGHHDLASCSNPDFVEVAAMLSVADYVCYACALMPYPEIPVIVPDAVWETSQVQQSDLPAVIEGFCTDMPLVKELVQMAA